MTDDRESVARETKLATWLFECFRENEADLKGLTVEEVANAFVDAKTDALHIMEWAKCADCDERLDPKLIACGAEGQPLCHSCDAVRREIAEEERASRVHAFKVRERVSELPADQIEMLQLKGMI